MEKDTLLGSDDDSRTASLGKKRQCEQSEREAPGEDTSQKIDSSPDSRAKRMRTNDNYPSPAVALHPLYLNEGQSISEGPESVQDKNVDEYHVFSNNPTRAPREVNSQDRPGDDIQGLGLFAHDKRDSEALGSQFTSNCHDSAPWHTVDYIRLTTPEDSALSDSMLINTTSHSTKSSPVLGPRKNRDGTGIMVIQLSKEECKTISRHELEMAEHILKRKVTNQLPSTAKLLVGFDVPLEIGKIKKKAPLRAARMGLEVHVAKFGWDGLVGYYYRNTDGPHSSRHRCNALLYYDSETKLDAAAIHLQASRVAFGPHTATVEVERPPLNFDTTDWVNTSSLRGRYGRARVKAVCNSLKYGELQREDYEPLCSTQHLEESILDGDSRADLDESSSENVLEEYEDGEIDSSNSVTRVSDGYPSTSTAEKNNGTVPSTTNLFTASAAMQPPMTVRYLSAIEKELQEKYWGLSQPNDVVRCIICAHEGHMEQTCPSRTCKHCQARDEHFSHACPMQRRCFRCGERGHDQQGCRSKRVLSESERLFCELCLEPGHVDEDCSYLWRTFALEKMLNLKKVATLRRGCYECGTDRHWGDDCAYRPKNSPINVDTFSNKQASKYLIMPYDAQSSGISIKGYASNASTVKDVNEEEDYLWEKMQQSERQKRVEPNLQLANDTMRSPAEHKLKNQTEIKEGNQMLSRSNQKHGGVQNPKQRGAQEPTRKEKGKEKGKEKKHMNISFSSDIPILGQASSGDLASRITYISPIDVARQKHTAAKAERDNELQKGKQNGKAPKYPPPQTSLGNGPPLSSNSHHRRSRSPQPRSGGYSNYRDRGEHISDNLRSTWQPPLPNEAPPPWQRQTQPVPASYSQPQQLNWDGSRQPQLPNEPIHRLRRQPQGRKQKSSQKLNQPPQTAPETGKTQKRKRKRNKNTNGEKP